MSYTSSILDLGTSMLFSFSFLNENKIPLDLKSQNSVEISKPFQFISTPLFTGKFLSLSQNSFFKILDVDNNYSSYSFSFWLKKGTENATIVDWGDESSGFRVNYINDSNFAEIIIRESDPDPLIVPITYVAIPEYSHFLFKIENSTIKVFVNAEEVYDGQYDQPSGDIVFGASGSFSIAEVALVNSEINQKDISMLYDVGARGFEKASFSLQSPITITDRIESVIQTVWQSYGQITTKK
jgi:hypothetical protein